MVSVQTEAKVSRSVWAAGRLRHRSSWQQSLHRHEQWLHEPLTSLWLWTFTALINVLSLLTPRTRLSQCIFILYILFWVAVTRLYRVVHSLLMESTHFSSQLSGGRYKLIFKFNGLYGKFQDSHSHIESLSQNNNNTSPTRPWMWLRWEMPLGISPGSSPKCHINKVWQNMSANHLQSRGRRARNQRSTSTKLETSLGYTLYKILPVSKQNKKTYPTQHPIMVHLILC